MAPGKEKDNAADFQCGSAASVQMAREEVAAGRSGVIVKVLPDSVDKNPDERLWEEA